MMGSIVKRLALLSSITVLGCGTPSGPEIDRLKVAMEAVRPLHQRMGPVMEGDWLFYKEEPGQTFQQYLESRPTLPSTTRRVLSVRPVGDLSPAQLRVVLLIAEYLGKFYGLPARVETALPIRSVPARKRRQDPNWGWEQIRTDYFLDLLEDTRPPDAAAHIGLTSVDLYPGEEMSFVFGQSSLNDRVGIWSLHRLGEPDRGPAEFHDALLRAMKIASHETGHMFSLRHCTKYECVMNGSASLYEIDRHPLEACPECMAKLCWATDYKPRERLNQLAGFFARHGLAAERASAERALKRLAPSP